MTEPRLWGIVGATGTGKTALSLDLAEQLARDGRTAEIVNADAMQLYRGMDIGTAKLAPEERRGIAHHLFDVLDITEEATVAWYQHTVRGVISEIFSRSNDVILVGGSGLYVSSAIYDFRFPPRDQALREQLEHQLNEQGIESLLAKLRSLSPEAADAIDTRNPRRVVRALEVALLGAEAQVLLPEAPVLWHTSTRLIGARCERAVLVDRLNARVEQMWREGMLAEVEALLPMGIERGKTASRAIGYAQALAQLRGELDEQQAIEQTQALTRRYARRQVSWFKRYENVRWIESGDRI